jgi:hypothetical protein
MVFQGHIENGVAVFDEPAALPEGMKVRIVPIAAVATSDRDGTTLAERFKNLIGAVDDLPDDIAENHDHYLYGTAKE